MSSDLKQCPCCGGRADEIHLRHMGHDGYRIYCTVCKITTETMHSRDAVIDRWNRRRTDASHCSSSYPEWVCGDCGV